MFDEILKQIREKIASHQYVMTIHAEEEMSEDGLAMLFTILNREFSRVQLKNAKETD